MDYRLSRFRGDLPSELVAAKSGPELKEIRGLIRQFIELLPISVIDLVTEADLRVIIPWFMRSLTIPGDVCEFGCFRGTMSVKMAYALKVLGLGEKTVYAFDTFDGFDFDDPSGGPLKAGAYADNDDAFGDLERWGKVLGLKAMKGDARETAKSLKKSLSFVWLDMDFDVLMEPTLDVIWPLISDQTIIGIDDVGRPETPSVEPWVDKLTQSGRLIELERVDKSWIRFFRAIKKGN